MTEKINVTGESFLKDELARNSAVMSAATTVAGGFNYLYQVYMGRVMGPEEYGIFGALFAIFYRHFVVSWMPRADAAAIWRMT